MTTRKKTRGASRTPTTREGWSNGAFFTGLICGALITLALTLLAPPSTPDAPVDPPPADADIAEPRASEFQFYTLLNELEVTVPDATDPGITPAEETIYWLQAGSFRNREDADQLRASLILLNLDASISQVNYQGTVWHRVMVGAFQSRTRMASARETLLENEIQPLLLMEKQPRTGSAQ